MKSLTGGRACRGLVSALVAMPLATASAADSEVPDPAAAERARIVAEILAVPGDGSPADIEARGGRLAQFGTAVLAPLVAVATQGEVRAGGATRRFGATESAVALRCVARLDAAAATDTLVAIARAAPQDRSRTAVLTLLGGVGRARAAAALVEVVALPAAESGALSGPARRAFETALDACLRSDADTARTIAQSWAALPRELRPGALRLGASPGTAASADLIAQVLETDPETSPVALAELPHVVRAAAGPTREAIVREVRERQTSGLFQGELARAVGHLRDEASIPWLLDVLGAPEPAPREAARWALAEMTDLRFAAEAAPWRTWHDAEMRWLRGRGERAERGLADPDPVKVLGWLREIAGRRLGRDGWAGRVAHLLSHARPSIRRAACATLRDLRSPAPVEALADALLDPDESVRREVHATLRALTGLDPPPDVHAWRAALRAR